MQLELTTTGVPAELLNQAQSQTQFNTFLSKRREAFSRIDDIYKWLHEEQIRYFGDDDHVINRHCEKLLENPSTEQAAFTVAKILVRRASILFAPQGTHLNIELKNVIEATGQKYADDEVLNLDAIWSYLRDTYEGSAGVEMAYQQYAELLIKKLYLQDTELKPASKASGKKSVEMGVYAEKPYSSSYQYRLYHTYGDAIRTVMQAIACFGTWAEIPSLITFAEDFISELDSRRVFHYDSREKRECDCMSIQMFKEKWVFTFTDSLVRDLQVFLSRYAGAKDSSQ